LYVVVAHQEANASTSLVEKPQPRLLFVYHIHPVRWLEMISTRIRQWIVALLVGQYSQATQCKNIENYTTLHGIAEATLNGRAKGKGEEKALIHDWSKGVKYAEKCICQALDHCDRQNFQPLLSGV
jgi:hypothetical protein